MAANPTSISGFPQAPFVDPQTGDIASVWRFFLMALWNRTGGSPGIDSGATAAQLAAETTARAAGDTSLANEISAEAATRTTAETTEAAARAAADTVLSARIAALSGGGAGGADAAMLSRLWFGR